MINNFTGRFEFLDNPFDWFLLKGTSDPQTSCTKLAVKRAPPRSLHGQAIVLTSLQKVESWLDVIGFFENIGTLPHDLASAERFHGMQLPLLATPAPGDDALADAVRVFRSAIEKPAELQGAAIEPGLVERILDDVGEEPGNLPLLTMNISAYSTF